MLSKTEVQNLTQDMKTYAGVVFQFQLFLTSVLEESGWEASPPGDLPKTAFLKLGTAELQGSAKGYQEFREKEIRNGRPKFLRKDQNSFGDIIH